MDSNLDSISAAVDPALQKEIDTLLEDGDGITAMDLLWTSAVERMQRASNGSAALQWATMTWVPYMHMYLGEGHPLPDSSSRVSVVVEQVRNLVSQDVDSPLYHCGCVQEQSSLMPKWIVCAPTISSSAMKRCDVDPREFATAMSNVASMSCSSPSSHDGEALMMEEEDDEGETNRLSLRHDDCRILFPALVSLFEANLGRLLTSSIRRSFRLFSSTSSNPLSRQEMLTHVLSAVASVMAWLPPWLTLLRTMALQLSQQDGDLEYVSMDNPCQSDAYDHSNTDAATSSGKTKKNNAAAASTIISPHVLEQVVLTKDVGFCSVTVDTLRSAISILNLHKLCAASATTSLALTTHQRQQDHVAGQVFLCICGLRWALLASHFDGDATLAPFVTACEEVDRQQRQRDRIHGGTANNAPHSSAVDLLAVSASWRERHASSSSERRIAELLRELDCWNSQDIPVHARLFDRVCELLRNRHGEIHHQPQTTLTGTNVMELALWWSRCISSVVNDATDEHGQGRKQKRRNREGFLFEPPSDIVSRMRDSVWMHGNFATDNDKGGSAVVTATDERQAWMQRMQRTTVLDAAVEPLLLCSDDEHDDEWERDGVGEDDEAEGATPLATLVDSMLEKKAAAAPLCCALYLIVLDSVSCTPPEDDKTTSVTPTAEHAWLWNGTLSTQCFVEHAMHVVRAAIASRSLAASASGLTLWFQLLHCVHRFSMDFPGEVRLVQMSAAVATAQDDEEDRHTAPLVECDDLLGNGGSDGVDGEGASHCRTTRFAHHFHFFRELCTMVTTSPSSLHRTAARFVLRRMHEWYVAPIRCKLLSSLIISAPYASVANALLFVLKDELCEAYKDAMAGGTSLAASTAWFINVAVLECMLRMLRKWTFMMVPPKYFCQATGHNRGSLAVSPSCTSPAAFVDCIATALNLVRNILVWDRGVASASLEKRTNTVSSSTSVDRGNASSTRGCLFDHGCGESNGRLTHIIVAASLKKTSSPSTSADSSSAKQPQKRLESPEEFLIRLDNDVLQPWARFCNEDDDDELQQQKKKESQQQTPEVISLSRHEERQLSAMDRFVIHGLVNSISQMIQSEQ